VGVRLIPIAEPKKRTPLGYPRLALSYVYVGASVGIFVIGITGANFKAVETRVVDATESTSPLDTVVVLEHHVADQKSHLAVVSWAAVGVAKSYDQVWSRNSDVVSTTRRNHRSRVNQPDVAKIQRRRQHFVRLPLLVAHPTINDGGARTAAIYDNSSEGTRPVFRKLASRQVMQREFADVQLRSIVRDELAFHLVALSLQRVQLFSDDSRLFFARLPKSFSGIRELDRKPRDDGSGESADRRTPINEWAPNHSQDNNENNSKEESAERTYKERLNGAVFLFGLVGFGAFIWYRDWRDK
jgi:hypothetical protein